MKTAKPHKRILVTAGPTREPIDPVRYISNLSTGLMGYKIAEEAVKRGHKVSLITGPVEIQPPKEIEVVNVVTAREMQKEVNKKVKKCDCIIMAAAVCDFRPEAESESKIKKQGRVTIDFIKNPDILAELTKNKELIKIGFALETENLIENAKEKLTKKGLDLIIANQKDGKDNPFGEGRKDYTLINKDGKIKELKGVEKKTCAKHILDEIEQIKK